MSVSNIYIIKIIIKLLPTIINFRRDRRDWVKREGKDVNEKNTKNMQKKRLKQYKKCNQYLPEFENIVKSFRFVDDPLPQLTDIEKQKI